VTAERAGDGELLLGLLLQQGVQAAMVRLEVDEVAVQRSLSATLRRGARGDASPRSGVRTLTSHWVAPRPMKPHLRLVRGGGQVTDGGRGAYGAGSRTAVQR
jgi:hypothetical protein